MKMKKYISLILAACTMLLTLSCTKDEISSESIFKDEEQNNTEFDSWLQRNYVELGKIHLFHHKWCILSNGYHYQNHIFPKHEYG